MINFAYSKLTKTGENAWRMERAPDEVEPYYVQPRFFFMHGLLNQENVRLCSLKEVLAENAPFVFPLELRWDFMVPFIREKPPVFFDSYIPQSVLQVARAGRAIIVAFIAHEAMPLSYLNEAGDKMVYVYDLLHDFAERHDLPNEALWFMTGDIKGAQEYNEWKQARNLDDKPDRFAAKFVDFFSYDIQAMRRLHEDGLDLFDDYELNPDRVQIYKSMSLALKPRQKSLSDFYIDSNAGGEIPTKLFLCMNRCHRPHRPYIVSYLKFRGYLDGSLVSFSDLNNGNINLEIPELQKAWTELAPMLPLKIDMDLALDPEKEMKTGLGSALMGDAWPYRQTFFSLVNETLFFDDKLFLSEKTWKPIMNCHPFIIVGSAGTLVYLRSLGFKTFHQFINEDYDAIIDPLQRLCSIFKSIELLAKLSNEELLNMRTQMQPIVQYNSRLLRSMVTPMEKLVDEMEAKLHKLSQHAVIHDRENRAYG